jgi:hypothetical protein
MVAEKDGDIAPSHQEGAGSAPLPSASEELARLDLKATPISELEDDHKRRFHEAWVKEHETHAKQADDDRGMRERDR